jgi:hypothetical protein
VVAINFSGRFSWAFIASAHKPNVIMQIVSDFRNLSLPGNTADQADNENSIGGALFLPPAHSPERIHSVRWVPDKYTY